MADTTIEEKQRRIDALWSERAIIHGRMTEMCDATGVKEAEIARLRGKIICQQGILRQTGWRFTTLSSYGAVTLKATNPEVYTEIERDLLRFHDHEAPRGVYLDAAGEVDVTRFGKEVLLVIGYGDNPATLYVWIERLHLQVDLTALDEALREAEQRAAFLTEIRGRFEQAAPHREAM